jgi:vancomycin resistance protein YoaR
MPAGVDRTESMPSLVVAAASSGTGVRSRRSGDDLGPPATPRRRRRFLRPLPLIGFALVLVLAGLVAAWGIDSTRTEGQVMRGVSLGDTPIGGLDRAELDTLLTELDGGLEAEPLTVRVDEIPIETNPAALGAELDREAVVDSALDARRSGSPLAAPVRWLASFVTEEVIEPSYLVDPDEAREGADGVITASLDQPVEPDLLLEGTELVVSSGRAGVKVEPQEIIEQLPGVLEAGGALEMTLTSVPAAPRYRDEQVQQVVDEVSGLTSAPVEFRVLDESAEVPPEIVREWVLLDDSGDEPGWLIDGDLALTELKPLFPELGSEDQRAKFSIVDGAPIIVPASETVICCSAESVASIRDALLAPAPAPEDGDEDGDEEAPLRVVSLEPEIVGSDEGVAELESLGIVEEVSSFTTNHDCCQNRVTNIHRFADLVRGAVIRPGEDFSLNGHVGQRTVEKGFVADSAIVEGVLEKQVGGGVSQFATTFFNAAFFAGLDFNEYQSHSLYISRYPRGREATISWKKPDLSVKNTTPYGILVWTSYTDTSITVTFYSTENVAVTTSEPSRSGQGQCSRWTTPRTRAYADGRTVEDSVFAVYRPAEGLDCNGNSTRPEADEPQGPTITPADPGTTTPTVPPAPVDTSTPPASGPGEAPTTLPGWGGALRRPA